MSEFQNPLTDANKLIKLREFWGTTPFWEELQTKPELVEKLMVIQRSEVSEEEKVKQNKKMYESMVETKSKSLPPQSVKVPPKLPPKPTVEPHKRAAIEEFLPPKTPPKPPALSIRVGRKSAVSLTGVVGGSFVISRGVVSRATQPEKKQDNPTQLEPGIPAVKKPIIMQRIIIEKVTPIVPLRNRLECLTDLVQMEEEAKAD